jgi:hypothetical protein
LDDLRIFGEFKPTEIWQDINLPEREREKIIERAETARSGPSSARPASLDCTRTLTEKKDALKFMLQIIWIPTMPS